MRWLYHETTWAYFFFYHCPEQVSEMTIVVIFPVTFYKTKSFNSKSSQKLRFCGSWNFLCAFKLFVKRWWWVCIANYHYCAKGRAGFARPKIMQQIAFSEKEGPQRAGKYVAPSIFISGAGSQMLFLTNLIKKEMGDKKYVCVCQLFWNIYIFQKYIGIYTS